MIALGKYFVISEENSGDKNIFVPNHFMKLFVTGLPEDMDHRDLQEMFELYGTISSAKVIMDHNTRKSKGFGFVEFVKESEARETMALLDGKMIHGKTLRVKPAEEQR